MKPHAFVGCFSIKWPLVGCNHLFSYLGQILVTSRLTFVGSAMMRFSGTTVALDIATVDGSEIRGRKPPGTQTEKTRRKYYDKLATSSGAGFLPSTVWVIPGANHEARTPTPIITGAYERCATRDGAIRSDRTRRPVHRCPWNTVGGRKQNITKRPHKNDWENHLHP